MKKKKTNDALYLNLQKSFIKIRALFSTPSVSPSKLDAALGDLRFARKRLEKKAKRRARKILIYCIDTLFEIVEEGEREKIHDFADLIHNMPEIALKKRTFRSFAKEINAFSYKYEESRFSDVNAIHIHISGDSIKQFFTPSHSEIHKKASRPINARTAAVSILAVFLLPLLFYVIYIIGLPEEQPRGGWPVVGILGCLVAGVGFCNIAAAFFHRYLGHKLTASLLLIGGAMIAASVLISKDPQLYNEDIFGFYFFSLFMMPLPSIFYFMFRFSVETYVLRVKQVSKSNFRNLLKGRKNYWWYEALHKEGYLGKIYYLNKIFTLLYITTFALTLITGFVKEMIFILCPMNLALHTLSAVMTAFARAEANRDRHGSAVVLWAKDKNGGVDSVLFDIFMVLFAFMPAYIIILLMQNIR